MLLSKVAEVTGGELHGEDALVTASVITDSREAQDGSLYVARVGEHADGHLYAGAARKAGAVALLGERAVEELPSVVVSDVELAFAKLARAVVDAVENLEIVGITGSSGKTSTKDLLGAVFSQFGPTVAPYGSLNSEVGVPLTVCRIDADTRYLVAEMGASGVGHIRYLTEIAPPKVGIVLNVGKAHMGEFGSVEAIAQTKGELVEALDTNGVAILNADDERVRAMATRTRARVVLVGQSEAATFRATNVRLDARGCATYTLTSPVGTAHVQLAVFGEHQVGNSLSVIATATSLGLPLDAVVKALATAGATSRWRMEVHELREGVTLINDAYNANPDSMRAALRALGHMGTGRRSIAVLGEMRELGEDSAAEHEAIGAFAVNQGVGNLVVVGEGARDIEAGATKAGLDSNFITYCANVEQAHQFLVQSRHPGDILLFKSSRDSGLRFLGDKLVDEFCVSTDATPEVTS